MSPTPKKKETVEDYFAMLDPMKRKISQAVRKTIKEAAPDIEEELKWGQPTYSKEGLVAYVFAAKDHVTLGFLKGATLKSLDERFQGSGKLMRSIQLRKPSEIPALIVRRAVQEAVRANQR